MNNSIGLSSLLSSDRVLTRPIDLIAHSSDASLYRLIPQAVVYPKSISEIQDLFSYSHTHSVPLTFRSAGTSLSGQSITDGILVDVSRFWRHFEILDNGNAILLQPGIVGGLANTILKPYGKRIGPDPASIDACMMGGIIANNASGMCCGVAENSYQTLKSLVFTLPCGATFNTDDPHFVDNLKDQAPDILNGILEIKNRIVSSRATVKRIRHKFQMKNTCGYSINAFTDFENINDIISHLLIGSEGTLAFIAEAVMKTLPSHPYKYTGMLYFNTVQDACEAIIPLQQSGARAIEIMDRASLKSVENKAGAPAVLATLPSTATALLVEYQSSAYEDIKLAKSKAEKICSELKLIEKPSFSDDPSEQAALWKIRKGLFTSIGSMRRPGTTVIIEDVLFPLASLPEAVSDLHTLFRKHKYEEAIIFGHSKDGNLHFVITPSFNTDKDIEQYEFFINDIVDIVVNKYDGALKAEHGTGRNMAPFIKNEWGQEIFEIMKDIKSLFDPGNILNPGVIINHDPCAHLKNIKNLPIIDPEVDKCIECGYCETKCPSRNLTFTPRQRIVVRREIKQLETNQADPSLLCELVDDFIYSGIETCAVDGSCSLACPIDINTGTLIKRLRSELVSSSENKIASFVANNFSLAEGVIRIAVGAGHFADSIIGTKAIIAFENAMEKITGAILPKWNPVVPKPNFHRIPLTDKTNAEFVYFPSCISRAMGNAPEGLKAPSLIEVVSTVSHRASINLFIPEDSPGNCCGMPFSSKGYKVAFQETLHRTLKKFWEWSDHGKNPIVIDSSSCAYTLLTCEPYLDNSDLEIYKQMKILDPIEFLHDFLLERLVISRPKPSVVLHPNCSSRKMHLEGKMEAVARKCAEKVTIPINLNCCGFAGDRGLLYPELTQSATQEEAREVLSSEYDGYYSNNLTCEMGMSLATRKPYCSIFYLVEETSRGQ